MTTLTVREEEAIATQGPRAALAIRAISHRLAGPLAPASATSADRGGPVSLLSRAAAVRLSAEAERRGYPPQAPISVALYINRDGYVDGPGAGEEGRDARLAFADSTWS